MLWYDASCRCLCVQSSMWSPLQSSPECAHLSPSTCKTLFMLLHLILCCPSSNCISYDIIKWWMTILVSYIPCLMARFFVCRVRWHHSLPTFGSEIALFARMPAPLFAGSPRCAFTLAKKVAVTAAILFRGILMAAARISASSAPTNVAFPPSPIHLLTSFNNDWLSHKYSNGSSISVSRSARKHCRFRPIWAGALFFSFHSALLLFLFHSQVILSCSHFALFVWTVCVCVALFY